MAAYAQSPACRRRQILEYFGETYEPANCRNCDNCTGEKRTVEASDGSITWNEIALLKGWLNRPADFSA